MFKFVTLCFIPWLKVVVFLTSLVYFLFCLVYIICKCSVGTGPNGDPVPYWFWVSSSPLGPCGRFCRHAAVWTCHHEVHASDFTEKTRCLSSSQTSRFNKKETNDSQGKEGAREKRRRASLEVEVKQRRRVCSVDGQMHTCGCVKTCPQRLSWRRIIITETTFLTPQLWPLLWSLRGVLVEVGVRVCLVPRRLVSTQLEPPTHTHAHAPTTLYSCFCEEFHRCNVGPSSIPYQLFYLFIQ